MPLKKYRYWIVSMSTSLVIVYCLNLFVMPVKVVGHSMDNTFKDGQYKFINKIVYRCWNPQVNDIIIFKTKNIPSAEYLIKRVVALGGSIVEISDNKLYVNGKEVIEPYIKEPMMTRYMKIEIPIGKVFVLGDNRNRSTDSRSELVGLVDVKDIIGKII